MQPNIQQIPIDESGRVTRTNVTETGDKDVVP
jgi:hypothetical protein